jgi:hypothetical protein
MKITEKIFIKKSLKNFHEKIVLAKGKGARVGIRRNSWLKQLRVAVSTRASMPRGQVHKIREQILSTCQTTFEVLKNLRRFQ